MKKTEQCRNRTGNRGMESMRGIEEFPSTQLFFGFFEFSDIGNSVTADDGTKSLAAAGTYIFK
ncbi:MAG: hypothetical protein GXP57_07225 [Deltaproteobacteria bacterium]|nr:hypothetical protein [Deltaproteobacteria bacterium]